MGHWRDGGIGGMAGRDDREASEFTLLERLTVLAGHSKTDAKFNVADVAQEAFDFIEPLAAAARRGYPLPMQWAWQPIETAPVPEWTESTPSYYRFRCLLQLETLMIDGKPTVCEGYGYYVIKVTRSGRLVYLRWNDGRHQCSPKYWMPLPEPKE